MVKDFECFIEQLSPYVENKDSVIFEIKDHGEISVKRESGIFISLSYKSLKDETQRQKIFDQVELLSKR